MNIQNKYLIDKIQCSSWDYKIIKNELKISDKKLLNKLLIIFEELLISTEIDKELLYKISIYVESILNDVNFSSEEKIKLYYKINTITNTFNQKIKLQNKNEYYFELLKNYFNTFDYNSEKKKISKVHLLIDLINCNRNISAIAEFQQEIYNLKDEIVFINYYNSLLNRTIFDIYFNNTNNILYNIFILKMFNTNIKIKNKENISRLIESIFPNENGKKKIYLKELRQIINNNITFNKNNLIQKYNLKAGYYKTPIIVPSPHKTVNNNFILSIDNSEGQTFKDDAISLKKENSNYILGIHVSDVGKAIYKNIDLNSILLERFKSLYLPGKTVYLFPKSSDISTKYSLNKGDNKSVISLYVIINSGVIKDFYFKEEEIKVTDNLSYYDAENIFTCSNKSEIKSFLFNIRNLFKEINLSPNSEYRLQKSFFLNKNNIGEYNTCAHKIIEECMILYNYLSSKLMNEMNYDYIYRNLTNVDKAFENKNITLNKKEKNILFKYYLNPYYSLINFGHCGVNKESYSHSSAPLRRYIDLYNQYLLHYYYFKDIDLLPYDNLEDLIEYSNQREKELSLCKYEFLMK